MVSAPLLQVGVFLAAAAIAAPLGRFTRMGAVLGYLAAGVVIGPYVLGPVYALTDVREVLAGARLVIGSRMHACLNSLSVGVPAIPLAYSQKFAPLLMDVGWRHSIRLGEAADPAAEVLRLAGDPALGAAVPAVRATADSKLAAARELISHLVPEPYSSKSPIK